MLMPSCPLSWATASHTRCRATTAGRWNQSGRPSSRCCPPDMSAASASPTSRATSATSSSGTAGASASVQNRSSVVTAASGPPTGTASTLR
ncbi:hypothetical protein ACFQX8_21625 [Klenkia terrae]|uniref:hypothetical protein n=1 Tax=Klenkia terrae TaxID=1052259 RepID=UPI00361969F7